MGRQGTGYPYGQRVQPLSKLVRLTLGTVALDTYTSVVHTLHCFCSVC
jgi:hypothetical protein